jgi:hypothetical protein
MTGKKVGRRERESGSQRERVLGREEEQHSGERKQCGLILTVGLNQQHPQTSTAPENFLKVTINNNNQRI